MHVSSMYIHKHCTDSYGSARMNSRPRAPAHRPTHPSAHTHPQGRCGFQAWEPAPAFPGAQSKSQKPEERVSTSVGIQVQLWGKGCPVS